MSWSPNLEENLSLANGLRPTFEQYDQQENYGLTTLRPKNAILKVNEDVYDCESDVSSINPDVRAVIEMDAYRRKFGPNRKTENRKWHEQQDEEDVEVEYEIANVIKSTGIEREPPSNYRLNSKKTHKAAIPIDKLPVAGRKNVFLPTDHFKFENPYFLSKPNLEAAVEKVEPSVDDNQSSRQIESSGVRSDTMHRKFFEEPAIGVAGEEYVSPTQLYLLKARRNR